jgi:adenylate cyclase
MQQPTLLAVMFADIVGSTSLYDRLGDVFAFKRVTYTIQKMGELVASNNGKVIKTIGDEVMCVFPTVEDSINCATEMNLLAIEGATATDRDIFMPVKIGVHFGEVVMSEDDVYGDTVNVASRMVGLSAQYEIIATREVVENLPQMMRARARFLSKKCVKGKELGVDIYQILMPEKNDADTTVMVGWKPTAAPDVEYILELIIDTKHYLMDHNRPRMVMGRSQDCTIVMEDSGVSRHHATIEKRGDSFVLIDSSANGTFVTIESRQQFLLLRNECRLVGSGIIRLGGKPIIISYRVTS